MYLDYFAIFSRMDYLLAGLWVTVYVSFLSIFFSFLIGVFVAIARGARSKTIRWTASIYLDIFRNTPFLIQLFFLYYGLPEIGISTNPIVTGIIALSLSMGSGNAEIIRAGIETVHGDIVQAARSFALTPYQIYRYVILPIALRISLRPLSSAFVNLVLTSSVLSSITVNDLMGNSMNIAAETFRPFEVYIALLLLYCVATFTVSAVFNLIYSLVFAKKTESPIFR